MDAEFVEQQRLHNQPEQVTLGSEVVARLRRVNLAQVLGGILVVSAVADALDGRYIRAGIQAYVGGKLLNE